MRIYGVAVLAHEHALAIFAGKIGIELSQLSGIELVPTDAIVGAQPPRRPVALPAGQRAVDEQMSEPLYQVACASIAQQRSKRLDSVLQERAQGSRLSGDLCWRTGTYEADQPGRHTRQIKQRQRKGTERVGEPFADMADGTWHRHRHHRGAVEAAGVAERGAPSGLAPVEEHDVVALAQQKAGRRHP